MLALRGCGLQPGLSECIDAYRAARIVGLQDRAALGDALGACLAKSEADCTLFDEVFARYFAFRPFGAPPAGTGETNDGEPLDAQSLQPDAAGPPLEALLRMIETGDRAGLARRLRLAEQQVGLSGAWLPTQRGLFTRRILEVMGQDQLLAAEHGMSAAGLDGEGGGTQRLRNARATLFEQVREYVRERVDLYGKDRAEQLRSDALSSRKLSTIERRDFERMRVLIQRLARRLATRHAQRQQRALRGRLDMRRTLTRNTAYDGVLFQTHWKERPITRPRVIAICDVSRSVAAHARFLLLLLYSLRNVLTDVRSFAFTRNLVDVSHHFERDPPHVGIERVLEQVGGTGTNYGVMLRDFARSELAGLDRRTVVLILGDGRNNHAEPEVGVLRAIQQRARRLVWLNPESRSFWGLGDSDMPRYAPCCHTLRECGTLLQLERAVDSLLRYV